MPLIYTTLGSGRKIDAGCVWDARTALRRAHAFQEFQVEWLEEPLRPDDVEGYRWLRDRSPLPIAGGEEECGRDAWRPLIDARALDVYQVDVARNGFTDADYIKHRVQEIGASEQIRVRSGDRLRLVKLDPTRPAEPPAPAQSSPENKP